MAAINIPGFTAEHSLRKDGTRYSMSASDNFHEQQRNVVPQLPVSFGSVCSECKPVFAGANRQRINLRFDPLELLRHRPLPRIPVVPVRKPACSATETLPRTF